MIFFFFWKNVIQARPCSSDDPCSWKKFLHTWFIYFK